jgi:hypothetical protein
VIEWRAVDDDPDPERPDVEGVAAAVCDRDPAVATGGHVEAGTRRRVRRGRHRLEDDAGGTGEGDADGHEDDGTDKRRDRTLGVAGGHGGRSAPDRT